MTGVRVAIVPEFPGYVVSADGRIQGPGHGGKRVWLKTRPDRDGYPYVTIKVAGKPGQTRIAVQAVVCTAFHGPRPTPKHEVAHANGVKTDNRAQNLRWATSKENHADRVRHGRTPAGARNPKAKLTEDDVREIRRRRAAGEMVIRLAQEFDVNRFTIRSVVNGKTWGNVR